MQGNPLLAAAKKQYRVAWQVFQRPLAVAKQVRHVVQRINIALPFHSPIEMQFFHVCRSHLADLLDHGGRYRINRISGTHHQGLHDRQRKRQVNDEMGARPSLRADIDAPAQPTEIGTGFQLNRTVNDFVVRDQKVGDAIRRFVFLASDANVKELGDLSQFSGFSAIRDTSEGRSSGWSQTNRCGGFSC